MMDFNPPMVSFIMTWGVQALHLQEKIYSGLLKTSILNEIIENFIGL